MSASKLPDILRLRSDGTLFCADGRDPKTYLAEWAKKVELTDETPINIMRSCDQQQERDDANLLRNWAS